MNTITIELDTIESEMLQARSDADGFDEPGKCAKACLLLGLMQRRIEDGPTISDEELWGAKERK